MIKNKLIEQNFFFWGKSFNKQIKINISSKSDGILKNKFSKKILLMLKKFIINLKGDNKYNMSGGYGNATSLFSW